MEQEFNITANAINRIEYLLSDEKPDSKFRIQVDGGGCNGFQYKFDFVNEIRPDDKIFGTDKVKIVIDNTSLEFLKGSTFDFVETLSASNFEFKNPNAASSCGCGNSFSV